MTAPTRRMDGTRVRVIASFSNINRVKVGDVGVSRRYELMDDGTFAYLVAFDDAVNLWVLGRYLGDA